MGEFDISLIREFRIRPAFYDRNSSRFKDKVFTARQWQEISNKLGYDVSLLKDRMLQLRNRYNLEKRRLELWREENPGRAIASPWPLYDELQFLSDHIRARRSYKSTPYAQQMLAAKSHMLETSAMMAGAADGGVGEASSSGSTPATSVEGGGGGMNGEDADGEDHGTATFPNGMVTVKMEEESVDEEEDAQTDADESGGGVGSNERFILPSSRNEMSMQQQAQKQRQQQQHQHSLNAAAVAAHQQQHMGIPSAVGLRPLSTLRRPGLAAAEAAAARKSMQAAAFATSTPQQSLKRKLNSSQNNNSNNHNSFNYSINSKTAQQQQIQQHVQQAAQYAPLLKVERFHELPPRERKFVSFGHFITASLLELPQNKALQLVERFTMDLVKVVMQKSDSSDSSSSAASNNDEAEMINGQ